MCVIPENVVWLILLSPFLSFAVISIVIRPFFNQFRNVSSHLTIASISISLFLSIWFLISVINNDVSIDSYQSQSWISLGILEISIGIISDPLTAIMLIVVTSVSLMVQIYSTSYMENDSGYSRYFAYMSLFTASMIGLIMASNVVQLYAFWELVGLSSYLLIGFWYHKPSAAAAAKKAFIITRFGDFGLLLAILYLFSNGETFAANGLNSLEISDINLAAKTGILASGVVTWVAIGIFAGAIGKSGQFPLHTWLPDAMEGPTPVSALIHAATMVAAGVFLVARFFDLFHSSEAAMTTVAVTGVFTALFAASMGLVMTDIKRVLAYSTISQLGYMMLALGIGAYGPAIFHLFTHAFFKALLFLGSGSVSHATGTFDMKYMGGLRKSMPWTYSTFLIGALSLSGIFPLAGFWSKDEILTHAWSSSMNISTIVYIFALLAVFMTAFYMFRVIFMTFEGDFKGGAQSDPSLNLINPDVHLQESPKAMVVPLLVLGLMSIIGGFLVNPPVNLVVIPEHWLSHFLHADSIKFNFVVAILSSLIAGAGILLAYLIYGQPKLISHSVYRITNPIHRVLINKYFLDEFYESFITTRVIYNSIAKSIDWADRLVIDGIVRQIGLVSRNLGKIIAPIQTGQSQGYGLILSLGTILIIVIYILFK